jgi:hypothetical protein
MTPCTHLDHVRITRLPESVEGCEECLATGGQWLHLRIRLECFVDELGLTIPDVQGETRIPPSPLG